VTAVADPDGGEVLYSRMRWNTPLSEDHAAILLERLGLTGGDEVLDLGCGWGELLLRAITDLPAARGTGVDSDPWAIQRGRDAAAKRGLSDLVTFVAGDCSAWKALANRVLCIGASHAWGGTVQALDALWGLVRPGGRVLFGDGYWEHPPTSNAVALFGDEMLPLGDLVQAVTAAGWRVIHLSTADQREWDDFEGTWRAGRQEWLLSNPNDSRAAEVRHKVDSQLRQYVDCYRGVLGFVYLVLSR
jgi:SAM-dependent methyltransferase